MLHNELYKHFSYTTLFFILLVHGNLAVEHCPALSLNFSDFGIEGCSPSFTVNSPEEVEEFLKAATCLGWGEWTLLPSIGCSSPNVPEGVVLEFPCECDFGGKCKVKCLPGYELEGERFIECQKDGTWTPLPQCILQKCSKPNLPAALEFAGECDFSEGKQCNLKCSSHEYRIEGSISYIECKNLKWSSFPACHRFCSLNEIPQWLVVKHGCTGNAKDICPVECQNAKHTLIGEQNIQCLESGEWAAIPVCGCSHDLVPDNIVLRQACTLAAGASCQAICAPSYYQKGDLNVLICDVDGAWNLETSIKCLKMCPEPVLPRGLEITNRCDPRRGDICKVKCTDILMRRTGPESFHCLSSGKFSPMPGCAKVDQCSATSFPETVQFVGNCHYTYGETCTVGCKDSSFVLKGSSSLTCTSSGTWNEIPDCVKYCPELKLKPNQQITRNTVCGTEVGDTCRVHCKKDYFPTSAIIAKCLPEGKWTELPDCQKMCNMPNLKNKVIFLRTCKREVGAVCALGCQENHLVITPTDKITCLEGAVWSEMPKCRVACDLESIHTYYPHVKFVKCPQMFEHEKCDLECADPNKILYGGRSLRCLSTGKLFADEDIKCVSQCKEMTLPDELKPVNNPEDCNYLKPGEFCTVKCQNKLGTLTGSKTITCLGDDIFSPFPSCEVVCKPPKLPRNTRIIGSCDNHEGSVCTIRCDHKKYHANGTQYFKDHKIVCQNGAWPIVPKCEVSCPPLNLSHTVQLRGRCEFKNNARCVITCKAPRALMIGIGIVECTRGKWRGQDSYCMQVCGHPHLPPHMEISRDFKCTRVINTQCKVVCEEPYVLKGSDAITCDPSSHWSAFPECVLLCPEVKYPLRLRPPCDRMPGTTCEVFCPVDYLPLSRDTVTCFETGVWDIIPECNPGMRQCNIPDYIMYPPTPCEHDQPCPFLCTDKNAILISTASLVCKADGRLEGIYPLCINRDNLCLPPIPPPDVYFTSCNAPHTIYSRCILNCAYSNYKLQGNKVIMCSPSGFWTKMGKCVKLCPRTGLGISSEIITGFCDREPGSYCPVTCHNNKEYRPLIYLCQEDSTWYILPESTKCKPITRADDIACLTITVPDYLYGESYNEHVYILKCLDSRYKIDGAPYVYCNRAYGIWSDFPKCILKEDVGYPSCGASDHDIPEFTCPSTEFGSQCTLVDTTCPIPTLRSAYCLTTGRWSPFYPRC